MDGDQDIRIQEIVDNFKSRAVLVTAAMIRCGTVGRILDCACLCMLIRVGLFHWSTALQFSCY